MKRNRRRMEQRVALGIVRAELRVHVSAEYEFAAESESWKNHKCVYGAFDVAFSSDESGNCHHPCTEHDLDAHGRCLCAWALSSAKVVNH